MPRREQSTEAPTGASTSSSERRTDRVAVEVPFAVSLVKGEQTRDIGIVIGLILTGAILCLPSFSYAQAQQEAEALSEEEAWHQIAEILSDAVAGRISRQLDTDSVLSEISNWVGAGTVSIDPDSGQLGFEHPGTTGASEWTPARLIYEPSTRALRLEAAGAGGPAVPLPEFYSGAEPNWRLPTAQEFKDMIDNVLELRRLSNFIRSARIAGFEVVASVPPALAVQIEFVD